MGGVDGQYDSLMAYADITVAVENDTGLLATAHIIISKQLKRFCTDLTSMLVSFFPLACPALCSGGTRAKHGVRIENFTRHDSMTFSRSMNCTEISHCPNVPASAIQVFAAQVFRGKGSFHIVV
jgi:hypothetical protein